MPAEAARRIRHHVGEAGSAKRGHRVLARTRAFEDIAAAIDAAVDIARLAGDADFALDAIVVRLELLQPEWPVFDGRSFWDAPGAIAFRRLADDLEVPG